MFTTKHKIIRIFVYKFASPLLSLFAIASYFNPPSFSSFLVASVVLKQSVSQSFPIGLSFSLLYCSVSVLLNNLPSATL